MRKFLRKHFEAMLIRIASKILIGRNVQRSAVVSRRDNNHMWGMSEELDAIADSIVTNYENS